MNINRATIHIYIFQEDGNCVFKEITIDTLPTIQYTTDDVRKQGALLIERAIKEVEGDLSDKTETK